ncbi:Single-stranded-DNA-specific exonuclease RecJ [Paraliobacillus sp. PM-2]|uniref:single-stranded-DNA-specific exonuclease RecJ n=1 Tax=Paraliobacillus sp. PM-2 TaxID=1462524 RepID=UPI00061B9C82|nr:single-stranded-DNA-specific exonuclease RecJ [Paraliobacillus sp. PM-2]CQR46947.1 Single-stranded-DNA-specific exonuclease RecJ [Paraliobacillus sp. PM-2]
MLHSQANWKYKNDEIKELVDTTFDGLGLSPLIERLLVKRNIQSKEEAVSFLQPNLDHLYDPSLLSGIDKAKQRINQAIDNGESILIYGDYDADGVSSTAVLVETLRELGAMCDYYIPNRFTEGYGPNEQAFQEAFKQGFQLIITVDTGIAAFGPAQLAKELGIDLIITDHHEVQSTLPDAYAIVHPKCSASYPFKELAGVGVAFKLAHYLLGYFPKQFLDLVVIGTIADLVPLVNENRILAYHGLKVISQSKRPGIIALKKIAGLSNTISEEDIGFLIGPRINAVGRLQSAYPALELLLTEDIEEARSIANDINEINQERQKIVADITEEAISHVESNQEANKHVIVVAQEGWNEGVLGIVASKLVRCYQRPAIVLTIQPEKQRAKGSARSISAFDMFENGMELAHLFLQFGGHAQAAGMTLSIKNVDFIRKELNQLAKQKLSLDDYKEQLDIEETIELADIDLNLIQTLDQLAPFGMGNPKPLFHIKAKPNELRQIGSKQNHLKATFQSEKQLIQAIGFGMGDLYPFISSQAVMDVVGFLQINEWNGKKNTQIMIQDVAIKDWQLFDFRGSKLWQKQMGNFDPSDTAIITFQPQSTFSSLPFEQYHFDQLKNEQAEKVLSNYKTIILADLPTKRQHTRELMKWVTPEKIIVSYQVTNSQLSQVFPNRNDFKWFYGMLLKRGSFVLSSDIPLLIKHKGWKKNKIELIISVFSELEFVKIDDGVIRPIKQPPKRDLTESHIYQEVIEQAKTEKIMYYSTYQELKDWITSLMEQNSSIKEEMIYGL